MQRIVTLRSSLIFASIAGSPFQWQRAKPPWISSPFVGKKIVEIALFVDLDGVLIAECSRLSIEIVLDLIEDLRTACDKLRATTGSGLFMGLIAAGNAELFRFDLARADFEPERNSLLDPGPAFLSAAQIARIDDDFAEGCP